MKNLPEKICLQIGKDCPDDADFKDLKEVTWSTEQIFKNDIVFLLDSSNEKLKRQNNEKIQSKTK